MEKKTQLSDWEIHSLFAQNRRELQDEISKMLLTNHVILDRYAYSGVAFSAAKGLDVEKCKSYDSGILKPDIVFFMDLNPELLQKREDFGLERYETLDIQTKAYKVFLQLKEPNWVTIDATKSINEISLLVRKNLNILKKGEYLW